MTPENFAYLIVPTLVALAYHWRIQSLKERIERLEAKREERIDATLARVDEAADALAAASARVRGRELQ